MKIVSGLFQMLPFCSDLMSVSFLTLQLVAREIIRRLLSHRQKALADGLLSNKAPLCKPVATDREQETFADLGVKR